MLRAKRACGQQPSSWRRGDRCCPLDLLAALLMPRVLRNSLDSSSLPVTDLHARTCVKICAESLSARWCLAH